MMKKDFWRNKKVLITGHEGFLGSNLAVFLIKRGAKVYGIDIVKNRPMTVLSGKHRLLQGYKADVADINAVTRIVKAVKPCFVFHLASEAIVGRAKKDPVRVFRSNIQGTWNVLEACRKIKSAEVILVASSDKAYGSSVKLPYTENMPVTGTHPYDASKSCEDIISRVYYHSYGMPVAVIRCGNIYGPGDFNFSRLIPDVISCALASKKFVMRSSGRFIRDYIYVDDVVAAYTAVAENMKAKKLQGEAFNISAGKPLSCIEVYDIIRNICGSGLDKKCVILNKAQDEIKEQSLCCKKIKKTIGWRSCYGFKEGIEKTLAWYRCNI